MAKPRSSWLWIVLLVAAGAGAAFLAFGGWLRSSSAPAPAEHLTEGDRQSLERVLEERAKP